MAIPVDSLASETWWSRAPYAFGKVALRFHPAPLAPTSDGSRPWAASTDS